METLDLFGHIKKQETLITLGNKNIAHCGVLESLHPFPGYHGKNLPDEEKPRSLFLLLSSKHSTEEVARHTKAIKKEFAIIKIYKNLLVREEEGNIYHDLEDKSKGYLEIPEKLDWESFREITFNIKNNLIHNNFDAALGVFFWAKGISDIIRIYDQDIGRAHV